MNATTERFQALKELSNQTPGAYLSTNVDGEWYMTVKGVEVKDTPSTAKGLGGSGKTADEAVSDCWKNATTRLDASQYLVVDGLKDTRKAYRWNGTRWAPVTEPAAF